MKIKKTRKFGFTLIEAIIGVTIFVMVAGSVYQAFSTLVKTARLSRLKVEATLIANEQLEIARNLPYSQVGTVGGVPSGVIVQDKTIERGGAKFFVKTTVRSIDDSFDGTLGGSPDDSSPADYKRVETNVTCPGCGVFPQIKLTTTISPKSLETTSNNGALLVNVFDALGQPVPGADIEIKNNAVGPIINLTDSSGSGGFLQLVDVPSSSQSYEISVSKSGYSRETTFPQGAPDNPNPTKPHATVASKQLTQISFSIDKLSTLNVLAASSACTSTPGLGFYLVGSKLIGVNPDIPKNNIYSSAGVNGEISFSSTEWDTYSVSVPVTSTSTHFLVGTIPMAPFSLLPDSIQNLLLVTKQKDPRGLLVSIKDIGSRLPITSAEVALRGGPVTEVLTTGRGSQVQGDWSGGSGQGEFVDQTRYYLSSGLSTNNPIGELRLASALGEYELDGFLESSTFDTGSSGSFYNIFWEPMDQPGAAGPDSIRFQVASNNGGGTWNFLGPNGTSNTYFTSSGESIGEAHSGNRYLRYKVFLHTDVATSTPNLSSVGFTFTSDCVPSGQVFFDGLSEGLYEIDVSKDGYQSVTSELVSVDEDWQEKIIYMTPN